MQDAQSIGIGQRSDDQVNGRQTMMPGTGKLSLSVKRSALNSIVHVHRREGQKLAEQLIVVSRASCRIPGFQQEREAGRYPSVLQPGRDLLGTRVGNRRLVKPRPR